MMREKKQLHAQDLEQNRARMKLMNKIRAFSVFEKHFKKNGYLKSLKDHKLALSSQPKAIWKHNSNFILLVSGAIIETDILVDICKWDYIYLGTLEN